MAHGTPPRVFHFPKITIVILSLVAERLEDMREKWTKIGAFVAVAGMALTGLAVELDLAGKWTLSGSNEVGAAISCPIAVPGDVHSALFKAKLMPDPFWGCNETNVQWVGRHDWTIERTFDVSTELLAHKKIILRLEDCDTFATIFVNGRKVGSTSDRFLRWDFDVKPFLKVGKNVICGEFASAWRKGDEIAAAYGRKYKMFEQPHSYVFNQAVIRKPACHKGWDWGLCQMITGFCGPTKLIADDMRRVDYLYADTEFNADMTHCTLTAYADCDDGSIVTNRVEIDNPPLWWPNGQGERRFCTYSVTVDGRRYEKRIGLRKIEVVNEKGSMYFKVNGRPIFAKGANWIPCSAFDAEQTPERYCDLLTSAAKANMNMIRLWGGGQYEKDVFYDLCDELGLLVWHDQMFACSEYPVEQRDFADLVARECAHQFRRLRDHASIALWCGGNECKTPVDVQWAAVATYDPTRPFWPSSPCANPNDVSGATFGTDKSGDSHNWEVWHKGKPLDEYYKSRPRFCSEFGFQSFSSRDVALTFCTPKHLIFGNSDFEWHQKNEGGNRRIRENFARYFKQPKDVPSELLLSQFQQAMAIQTAVDAWRGDQPRCMGTLFWQLNDNWPVSSWSSIEYGGKWKPLQYLARRFFEPVHVILAPDGTVKVINDTEKELSGRVEATFYGFDGKTEKLTVGEVKVPANSAVAAGKVEPRAEAALELRFGGAVNFPVRAKYNDVELPQAKVVAEVDGFKVTLTTDKPAFWVWLNVKGVPGEFNDNAVTLVPGKSRVFKFTPADRKLSAEEFKKNLTVTHLRELY